MKRITKEQLREKLNLDYGIDVHTTQITLTKNKINNLMIVEGIGGYGFFRYGYDNFGNIKLYPNKMHSVNINV